MSFLDPKGTFRAKKYHPKNLNVVFNHLSIQMNFMVTDGLI